VRNQECKEGFGQVTGGGGWGGDAGAFRHAIFWVFAKDVVSLQEEGGGSCVALRKKIRKIRTRYGRSDDVEMGKKVMMYK
jgi:hypothetical protein